MFPLDLAALSLISQQVTENLFGPFLSGPIMRVVALGVAVGLGYGAWTLGLFGPIPMSQALVYGGISGLGSSVVHGLLNHFAPAANDSPLLSVGQPQRE